MEIKELETQLETLKSNVAELENKIVEIKRNEEDKKNKIPDDVKDIPQIYDFDDYKKLSECWREAWIINFRDEDKLVRTDIGRTELKGNMIFPTKEFAEMFREKAQLIADCLLFKWMYDREYVPNWENNSYKHGVCVRNGNFDVDLVRFADFNAIYFSSEEIAQKCIEWLDYKYFGIYNFKEGESNEN